MNLEVAGAENPIPQVLKSENQWSLKSQNMQISSKHKSAQNHV